MGSLVLGAGGLLGSEVLSACRRRGHRAPDTAGVFDWARPDVLSDQVHRFARQALDGTTEEILVVYWCAGVGYVGSTPHDLERATSALHGALRGLEPVVRSGVRVHVTYSSSAGAVWSGAPSMPVAESSPPAPLHAYGRAKLAEEDIVREWADVHQATATIARVSNLFGQNQNATKNQGLLTKLVASSISGVPTTLYVSLDTCRDYVPAATAAQMLIADATEVIGAADTHSTGTTVRIVASERAYTIAQVCGILQRMRRRRVPVAHVVSNATSQQPARLTFRSNRPSLGIDIPSLEESLREMFEDESRRLAVPT